MAKVIGTLSRQMPRKVIKSTRFEGCSCASAMFEAPDKGRGVEIFFHFSIGRGGGVAKKWEVLETDVDRYVRTGHLLLTPISKSAVVQYNAIKIQELGEEWQLMLYDARDYRQRPGAGQRWGPQAKSRVLAGFR